MSDEKEAVLLTQAEVGQVLNLPPSAIKKMIERGILEPVSPPGKKPVMFHAQDVSGVVRVLEDKVHISKIYNRALQAQATASRVERKMDELLEAFGIQDNRLPQEEWNIRGLDSKIYRAMRMDSSTLSPEEVIDWAKVFLAIDESYLVLAAYYLNTSEPWVRILWFGQRLLEKAPTYLYTSRIDLEMAYGMLRYAVRYFYQVAYFYCRKLKGATAANLRLPEAKSDVTSAISTVMTVAVEEYGRTLTKKNRGGHLRRAYKSKD